MPIVPSQDRVILEMRRHVFYFYLKAGGTLLIALLPPIMLGLLVNFSGMLLTEHILAFFVFLYSIILIATWVNLFVSWTIYTLDVWILTDKQVIDFVITSLFHHDTASVGLDKIQDVKVEVNGILDNLIKSGNLYIQTAGAIREFIIRGADNPQNMKLKIQEAMNEFRNNYHDHTPST